MTTNDQHPTVDAMKVWILLDQSGSMRRLQEDVIGGTNQFLAEQRRGAGECRLTLVAFDTAAPFQLIVDDAPIADAPNLDAASYRPRGGTPLYDALGTLIARADQRISKRLQRNQGREDQTVLIYTDGLENSSTDFDRQQTRDLIEARTALGWQFIYLGANQDAYAESGKIGIARGNTANFDASGVGVRRSARMYSAGVTRQRAMSREERAHRRDQFFEQPPSPEPDDASC